MTCLDLIPITDLSALSVEMIVSIQFTTPYAISKVKSGAVLLALAIKPIQATTHVLRPGFLAGCLSRYTPVNNLDMSFWFAYRPSILKKS